eukprot:6106600-Heterocapsa_arctica.AAC.1
MSIPGLTSPYCPLFFPHFFTTAACRRWSRPRAAPRRSCPEQLHVGHDPDQVDAVLDPDALVDLRVPL